MDWIAILICTWVLPFTLFYFVMRVFGVLGFKEGDRSSKGILALFRITTMVWVYLSKVPS